MTLEDAIKDMPPLIEEDIMMAALFAANVSEIADCVAGRQPNSAGYEIKHAVLYLDAAANRLGFKLVPIGEYV